MQIDDRFLAVPACTSNIRFDSPDFSLRHSVSLASNSDSYVGASIIYGIIDVAIGAASSFESLMRFVCGYEFAARRVARHVVS